MIGIIFVAGGLFVGLLVLWFIYELVGPYALLAIGLIFIVAGLHAPLNPLLGLPSGLPLDILLVIVGFGLIVGVAYMYNLTRDLPRR